MAAAGEAGVLGLVRHALSTGTCAGHGVEVGPGDDAAVVTATGKQSMTLDAISAGSDWLPDRTPPRAIGHRAVAVSLSDLAAMGAHPRWLLLGLELAPRTRMDALEAALAGAVALARAHDVALIGGDIGIRRGPTTWTSAAVGTHAHPPLLRSTARPGDRVWCVGGLGLAALGLHALSADQPPAWPPELVSRALAAHLWPSPQVAWGLALAATTARIACIDISDGLGLDAERVAAASGVALALDIDTPPGWRQADVDALNAAEAPWQACVAAGGDDYALLVCAPGDFDVAAIRPEGAPTAVPIGRVAAGVGVTLRLAGVDASQWLGGHLHGRRGRKPS